MNVYIHDDIEGEVTQMIDTQGGNNAIVVVKQSFSIPVVRNEQPVALKENWSLFYEDISVGEPGLTPTLFENDFVLRKQKCDIVVNAKAYNTDTDKKKDSFVAGFQVADCQKRADVINEYSETEQPIPVWLHYGSTWGGISQKEEDLQVFPANPMGKCFVAKKHKKITQSIVFPEVLYPNDRKSYINSELLKPCAFSTLGRNATPRLGYAGTYDDKWYKEVFPLLPKNFDERFFQCVPEDQQIPFPTGGETVEFLNLHPENPYISFQLPKVNIPVVIKDQQSEIHHLTPVIDTLQFDLEKLEFSMVWRCHHPVKRSLREIKVAVVGNVDKETYEQLLDCGSGGCGDSSGKSTCGDCTAESMNKELTPKESNEIALSSLTDAMKSDNVPLNAHK